MLTKSWLRAKNINYIEKSVETASVADELILMGYRSTPVVVIEDTVVVGYSPRKLAEALS